MIIAWLLACLGGPDVEPLPVEAPPILEQPTPPPDDAPVVEAPPEPEAPPPVGAPNRPPEGWVDLTEHIPGLRVDIRYHTANNFTGAPLPGYGHPGAWLQRAPADALRQVHATLASQGYGLLVYDAYRPLRGTLAMVAWAHRTGQAHLLDDGYIARRSGHNKGNTVDLSVFTLDSGLEIDMGTPWDTLTEQSHTTKASGAALANRMILRDAMHAHGWRNYWKEWWHFTFEMTGDLRHRDVPYACWEPAEGDWRAPEGWSGPGYVMPAAHVPAACPP
jgi:D-alanyl-D-alanine dipeptidase